MKKANSVVLKPLEKENIFKRFARYCAGLKDSQYIYLCAVMLVNRKYLHI